MINAVGIEGTHVGWGRLVPVGVAVVVVPGKVTGVGWGEYVLGQSLGEEYGVDGGGVEE